MVLRICPRMAWHGMAGPVHAPAWALLCCHCRLPLDWQCRWPSAGTEQQGTRSCDEPPSPIGLFSSTHGAPRLPHQHGQSCTARHARQEQACESIAPAVIFCQPHPRPISSAHVKPDFFFSSTARQSSEPDRQLDMHRHCKPSANPPERMVQMAADRPECCFSQSAQSNCLARAPACHLRLQASFALMPDWPHDR